ncbi:unnamed protein product [Lymnaea stagnalis]|uniref:DUF1868 domain-containing protein n=1 Tax=Lymnaea stagnalis TaxID=6523 RepID=A0AAV2IB14_LYMST
MTTTRLNKNAILIPVLLIGSAAFIYILTRRVGSTLWKRGVEEGLDKPSKPDMKPEVKKPDKIGLDGHYLPFYGFTIVSMLTDRLQMEDVIKYIKSTEALSKYLAPLPISSYHVTIFDIFTQRSVPEKYRPKSGLVPSKHWAKALENFRSDMTESQMMCDKIQGQNSFRPNNFKFQPKLGRPLLVEGTITNYQEVTRVRNNLTSLLKKDDGNRVFHFTLGYIYRDVDRQDLGIIDKELVGLWKLLNTEYELDQPNVYYFETMEEFIPYKTLLI